VYRPTDDRRLVYLRVIDERRPGIVIRIRIFDIDSWELVRDDEVRDEPRQDDRPGQERPRDQRPPEHRPPVQPPARDTARPPEPKPPEARPPEQRPPLPLMEIIRPVQPPPAQPPPPPAQPPPVQPPPEQRPPDNKPPEPPPGPFAALTLDIPPGHLPEVGECRVWIPGLPPGQQAKPKSRACDGITSVAPAGSWIIYRPSEDRKVVHVRLIDERRAGLVIRIRTFDIDTKRLLREENP
jgi:hypothetical protein